MDRQSPRSKPSVEGSHQGVLKTREQGILTMRIGLIGFGKTGQAVASVILHNPDISLEWIVRNSDRLAHRSGPEFLGVSSSDPGTIYPRPEFRIEELLDRYPVDAIIDFSSEDGVEYYGREAARRGITIVSAVSHYSSVRRRQLRTLSRDTAVLWSPNITVGINFLILAAKTLSQIAPSADVEIIEEHFKLKNGVSGTAKIIAESLGRKETEIKSIRAGGIIGVHEILFGFPFQTVRLRHESISRDAFGAGAVFAAQKLSVLPPGLYKMEDLLLPYFDGGRTKKSAERRRFSRYIHRLRIRRRPRVEVTELALPAVTVPDSVPPLPEPSGTLQR